MVNKTKSIFSSTIIGESVSIAIERAISEHNMLEKIKEGVLVGLSGGADSVMLLIYLVELRKRIGDFSILAVHINHMIRGEEAYRDELFSKELSKKLGVQFISSRLDVPKIAREESLSLEEAARNARYSEFQRIIESRNDISHIALAHNATDNMETVLFNVLRGSGSRGASGIPPVRDNILRPLILVSKKDILRMLDDAGIEYMTDSTNLLNDYSRNYIRNNILPHIHRLSSDPERSFSRLSRNLRCDDDYIMEQAKAFLDGRERVGTRELASLHKSLLHRVLSIMASKYSITLENAHIDSIHSCLSNDKFTIYLPGSIRFVSEHGIAYMTDSVIDNIDYFYNIKEGQTKISEYNADFYLTDKKVKKSSLNVYKKSIQVDISSAIIYGRLFIRPKRDGDTVFYGGMTHKLKKMFNDRKIPVSDRPLIPILCDDKGVVWVPGYGVRDDRKDGSKGALYATLAIKESEADDSYSFCFAERIKQSSTGK
jgi:tRNA(Ile)-lysidine synthase